MTLSRRALPFALAAVAVLALADSLFAADGLFAVSRPGYFGRFLEYWGGMFKKQSGISMIMIGTGVLSIFIITRGKWKK